MSRLASLLRAAVGLLLDEACASCDEPLGRLFGPACPRCLAALAGAAGPRCPSCSRPAPGAVEAGCCPACRRRVPRPPIAAPRPHEGVARRLVLALKFAQRPEAAEVLARATALDPTVRALLRRADLLVPVPAHPLRRRERGYDQAELLARELLVQGRAFGSRARLALLLRRRSGRPAQAGRSGSSRRRGLARTLRPAAWAAARVRGRRVLLVDDVVTTGASLRAASRLLGRLGATDLAAVAITRALEPSLPGGVA